MLMIIHIQKRTATDTALLSHNKICFYFIFNFLCTNTHTQTQLTKVIDFRIII